ncbi:hypothetical protein ACTI_05480 [Actinoplanes sp. OR16]|uniref:hypothetical protein n=1 Tax=Actinoplanes sp. OR16 TaxID=946334 RepID=UPI000F71CADA|nr:hypothetical protein [Actinoplanes sp. OR16]BBH63863.1 hypothetical protein ACTI_05480 [Actinoplanes sp. OR16]
MLLDSVRCLPFEAVEADSNAGHRLARAAQAIDEANRREAELANQFEDRVVGEYIAGSTDSLVPPPSAGLTQR